MRSSIGSSFTFHEVAGWESNGWLSGAPADGFSAVIGGRVAVRIFLGLVARRVGWSVSGGPK